MGDKSKGNISNHNNKELNLSRNSKESSLNNKENNLSNNGDSNNTSPNNKGNNKESHNSNSSRRIRSRNDWSRRVRPDRVGFLDAGGGCGAATEARAAVRRFRRQGCARALRT